MLLTLPLFLHISVLSLTVPGTVRFIEEKQTIYLTIERAIINKNDYFFELIKLFKYL
jgi:hypothetical protein